MDQIIAHFKTSTANIANQLKEDLKSIRTGKANPAILEGIIVETYGGSTKLKLMELASLTTEGASAMAIIPFDPSTSQDIEKAILKSPLGLSPQPQGGKIIVRVPQMSQDQREKYVKLVSQKTEERKVMIRNERDNARKKIKALLDDKAITEDQKFRSDKEIDTLTQNATTELQTIREHKEREIMEV